MLIPSTSLLLLICGLQLCRATPASSTERLAPRAASDSCGQASQAAIQYANNHPNGDIEIDPELAYQCLTSVPIYTDPALALILSLLGWVELQSHLDILKSIPQGYLYDSVDLRKELSNIFNQVENGQYYSEYDFQIDVESLFIRAREGHFYFAGELQSIFSFARPLGLVSVSQDGKTIPEVYVTEEIYEISKSGIFQKHDNALSAVKKINNIEVNVFLAAESFTYPSQDPDECWNNMFDNLLRISLGRLGGFRHPTFYPGVETTIEFVNGSIFSYPNKALVNRDLTNITTGEDVYERFCVHPDQPTSTTTTATASVEIATSTIQSATTKPTPIVEITYYPPPIIVDSSGIVLGYFLDSPYEDTAVLSIVSFAPFSPDLTPKDFPISSQSAVEEFLALALQESKTNLILDLQHNGGGSIDLSIDTYAQLFPNDPPDAKHNMRTSAGMEIIMKAAAAWVDDQSALDISPFDEEELTADILSKPLAWQNVITPDAVNFNSFEAYYGPNKIASAEYTAFFQDNYTNAEASEAGMGAIVITGTNDRVGYDQHFESKSLVLLHDGACGSACTIFSEYMKNHGRVQSIAIGGRPQTGPMQGIGGTKGSQVFKGINIELIIWLFDHSEDLGVTDYEQIVKGTAFESWDPSVAVIRSTIFAINGRNHYRIDDKTQTALQFVYEASDCRIWFTPEMVADVMLTWERVADIAFRGPAAGVFNSEYCIQDSTGHPTSLSGGLKKGEIGDQNPPTNAKPSVKGWLINGTTISEHGPARYASPGNGQNVIAGAPLDKTALRTFVDGCLEDGEDQGEYWLWTLICKAVIAGDKWQ